MPVFEPDGTELKPLPVEELEQIGEIGGEFDETSVTVSVYSRALDRQRVTRTLGVEPTMAWNPGESHLIGLRGRTRIVDWGKWYRSTPSDKRPVEDKIRELLGECTDSLENWHELTQEYDVWLTIGAHLNNWNRELDLSSEVLRMLTERHLCLKIDVYFDGDDESK